MTVKYQLSDKRGEAILLVAVEDTTPEHAWNAFVLASAEAGFQATIDSFGSEGLDPLAAARRTVQAAFPGAQPVQQEPWGQPPVQPLQQPQYQQQPQVPAAAQQGGKTCHHGPMTYREGTGKTGKPYRAWFCPARSSDPTQCQPEFIR